MTLTHVILVCDESGAKGYAVANNLDTDEIGVFAGVMVPAELLPTVREEFDHIVSRYAPADNKLHITDLSREAQDALRNDTYELIRKHRLPCFYEAIHLAGFNNAHGPLVAAVEKARQARTSSVRMSENPVTAPSLHVTLFEGIFSKVVAFCMERQKSRLHVEVWTDNVDQPIALEFEKAARKLTDYSPTVNNVTGYDTETKKVRRGYVKVGPSQNAALPVSIEHFELKTIGDSNGLVVAADVLANSLHHLFKSRPDDERYTALNTPEAFARHPLQNCLDSFESWEGYNFTDTYYRHPRDPAREEAPEKTKAKPTD
jgi:hypothetical protein